MHFFCCQPNGTSYRFEERRTDDNEVRKRAHGLLHEWNEVVKCYNNNGTIVEQLAYRLRLFQSGILAVNV